MSVRQVAATIPILLAQLSIGCSAVDRGTFGPFERSLNATGHGYAVEKDPTGLAPTRTVEVFRVEPGDCADDPGWSDCENDRERSELKETDKDNHRGDEHWYGWSLYLPEDYPNVFPTKTALGQFHQDGSHPVWMFQNSDGGYHLDDQVFGSSRKYHELIAEDALRGRWHTIEVHARWATDRSGFLRVWVNGQRKVDHEGKTTSTSPVYFKYGVYRTFMSRYRNANGTEAVPAQTVYFANVRRADTRQGLAAAR